MNTEQTPGSIAQLVKDVLAAGGTVEQISAHRLRVGVPRRVVGGGTAIWNGYVAWMMQDNGRWLTAGTKIVRLWLNEQR